MAADGALHPSTVAVTSGRPAAAPGAPVNVGVELSSTFRSGTPSTYGRARNATWEALEEALGTLEGGHAVAFSSGMAAVSAVSALVPPGGVVVLDGGAYHGARELFEAAADTGRLDVRFVDTTDDSAAVDACTGAALVWLETPTNPLLGVVDVVSWAATARAVGAPGVLVVVDNTFATPLLQRPLHLGADVVVHSATKFLSGHSDVLLGAAVAGEEAVAQSLIQHRIRHGAVAGPLDAYLVLRGVRTLAVRLERAQATAAELARRLLAHPQVEVVRWPGLDGHPAAALAGRQMNGPGAVLSFDLAGGAVAAEAVCAAVRLIVNATSLGGVETLLERRAKYPGEAHLPPGLLRLSVGLEHVDDLWADLAQALAAADR